MRTFTYIFGKNIARASQHQKVNRYHVRMDKCMHRSVYSDLSIKMSIGYSAGHDQEEI